LDIFDIATAPNGVVTITINKPPVNAPRFAEIAHLDEIVSSLASPDIRCLVIAAAGDKAFIAGTDVNDFVDLTPETTEANTAIVQRLKDRIYEFPVPVLCAINGVTVGFGMGVVASADIRVASQRAVFGLPEIDVGILGGAKHLARLVPQGKARLMMYTGWRIGAEEAHRIGLVDVLVAHDELMPETMKIADSIAAKFAPAIRLAKQGFNRTETMGLKEGYAYECTLSAQLRQYPEAAELSRAFFERRRQRGSEKK